MEGVISDICQIIVTNSLPQTETSEYFGSQLEVVDISGMVSEFIRRSHYNESVSVLSQGFHTGLRDLYRLQNRPRAHQPSESDTESDQEQLEESETISAAEDLNLRRVRKGFRLESICWD